MKTLLLLATLFFCFTANSQDIIFKVNQHGVSYKDSKGIYKDAVIKDADILITLRDRMVTVFDENPTDLELEKLNEEYTSSKNSYSKLWKAVDNSRKPVKFKYTVNVASKAATVEVIYKNYKNYYFGTYDSATEVEKKKEESAKAF